MGLKSNLLFSTRFLSLLTFHMFFLWWRQPQHLMMNFSSIDLGFATKKHDAWIKVPNEFSQMSSDDFTLERHSIESWLVNRDPYICL